MNPKSILNYKHPLLKSELHDFTYCRCSRFVCFLRSFTTEITIIKRLEITIIKQISSLTALRGRIGYKVLLQLNFVVRIPKIMK